MWTKIVTLHTSSQTKVGAKKVNIKSEGPFRSAISTSAILKIMFLKSPHLKSYMRLVKQVKKSFYFILFYFIN
jgi:hypothetical protein